MTQWLRSFCWFGILLPLLAGCGVLDPYAETARDTGRAGNTQRAGERSGPKQEVVQASHQEDAARVPARFDVERLRATNQRAIVPAQHLDEAKPIAAGGMTFDQAVGATLLADPKIRAGFEVIVQARGDLVTSSLLPNPNVLVDGLMFPTRVVTPANTSGPTQMDVFVSYPIDWFLFGKRTAAIASARLGVQQSEAEYADLIRQRVLACAAAFYDVVEAKQLLTLAEADLANFKKVEAITEKAVKAGNRSQVDLERVRIDILKSEQSVRDGQATVAVAKARLRSLLGRFDADPDFDVDADLDRPLSAELMPLEQAFAAALENRPDLQSLQVQVAKADADVAVENRKMYPELTPGFGYTRQFQGSALGQPDAETWNANLIGTLPIFNRNQGNRQKARSVAVQNRLNLDTARVGLRAEVTQVFKELETAEKNAQAIAEGQKKRAKDVLDAITKSYEVIGGRPYVDVLEAQRTYRETYRAYINSRANYWRAVYRFSAAIGKQITPSEH